MKFRPKTVAVIGLSVATLAGIGIPEATAMTAPRIVAEVYTTPGSGCSMIKGAQSLFGAVNLKPGKTTTKKLTATQIVGSADPVDRVTIASKSTVTAKLTTKHKAFSAITLRGSGSVSMDPTLGHSGTACQGIDTDVSQRFQGMIKVKGKGTLRLSVTATGSPGSSGGLRILGPGGVDQFLIAGTGSTSRLSISVTQSGSYLIGISGSVDLEIGKVANAASTITATGTFVKAGQ